MITAHQIVRLCELVYEEIGLHASITEDKHDFRSIRCEFSYSMCNSPSRDPAHYQMVVVASYDRMPWGDEKAARYLVEAVVGEFKHQFRRSHDRHFEDIKEKNNSHAFLSGGDIHTFYEDFYKQKPTSKPASDVWKVMKAR